MHVCKILVALFSPSRCQYVVKMCAECLHAGPEVCAMQMESGMEVKQRMVAEKLTVSELVTTQLLALPPVVQVLNLTPHAYLRHRAQG